VMAITKMHLFETGAPERKSPAEHHPALTNCFFHSSALIGSSLMPYHGVDLHMVSEQAEVAPEPTSACCGPS
jgi:hypothetical protein